MAGLSTWQVLSSAGVANQAWKEADRRDRQDQIAQLQLEEANRRARTLEERAVQGGLYKPSDLPTMTPPAARPIKDVGPGRMQVQPDGTMVPVAAGAAATGAGVSAPATAYNAPAPVTGAPIEEIKLGAYPRPTTTVAGAERARNNGTILGDDMTLERWRTLTPQQKERHLQAIADRQTAANWAAAPSLALGSLGNAGLQVVEGAATFGERIGRMLGFDTGDGIVPANPPRAYDLTNGWYPTGISEQAYEEYLRTGKLPPASASAGAAEQPKPESPTAQQPSRNAGVQQGQVGAVAQAQSGALPGTLPAVPNIVEHVFKQSEINPNYVPMQIQQAMQTREVLANEYRWASMSGDAQGAVAAITAIQQIDNNLWTMQGIHGMAELANLNNPSRLSMVMSHIFQRPFEYQMRTDGQLDVFIDGEYKETLPMEVALDNAQAVFDASFIEREREANAKLAENQHELQKEYLKGMLDYRGTVDAAQVRANATLSGLRYAAGAQGSDWKLDSTTGLIYRTGPDGMPQMYRMDLQGTEHDINGTDTQLYDNPELVPFRNLPPGFVRSFVLGDAEE